jgi:uncharacterized membrane protein YfcA
MSALVIYAGIFFLAALIHGSTGFGFPMIATPLLALFTDVQTAIVLTLIPTLVVNVVSIASESGFLQAIRKHLVLALLAMIGSGVGTLILLHSSADIFELLLSTAIILYLVAGKIRLNLSWIPAHPRASRFAFGFAAGMLGGLTNVMAPVLIIYAMESQFSRKDLIQASNFCFLFGKVIQLVVFSAHGRFTLVELQTSFFAILAVGVALALGVAVRRRLSPEMYMGILRGFLLLLALMLLFKALS